ncbi:hypothetical protein BT63DRAFT_428710 [Microthyrium microscopicum]|uniref:Uncharacterized protein n=1 Tax=Microthyrium microscopicum TaxID=703497 RepID=A0A6A6U0A8_9PEZI|nr:hypothetical protein BT63DRAFT_428710 [Microthyrium microscopicum]
MQRAGIFGLLRGFLKWLVVRGLLSLNITWSYGISLTWVMGIVLTWAMAVLLTWVMVGC